MSITLEKKDRNVIPRWRGFQETTESNELANRVGSASPTPKLQYDISEQIRGWLENRTVSFAGDLLSAAIICQDPGAAREAAEYVLGIGLGEDRPVVKIARRVLEPSTMALPIEIAELGSELTTPGQRSKIHRLRQSLRMFPRDAIAWVDLARMYTVLGLNEQAEKAIRIACNLAPQNRFVIRSAARFYAHIGEMDRAHDLVLSSGACKYDPWLAASEVALATLAKRYPRSATTGLGMISGGDFSDFDITELATAIGTLDFMNGQNHKAKKLVRRALVAPNDNSLAQAKWISRTMSGLPIDVKVSEFQIPRQFEASAYETFSLGQWRESLSASLNWCKDEPFSSRAAQMACYIAGALLEDYDFCVRIANFGLVANPEDEMLINQRAFCFASLDRIDLATEELARLKGATLTDNGRITWYANHGLVAFRSGRIDEARVWYLKAADLAASVENARYYTTALLYWAREEALRDTAACPELIERVRRKIDPRKDPDFDFILKRIESRCQRPERAKTPQP